MDSSSNFNHAICNFNRRPKPKVCDGSESRVHLLKQASKQATYCTSPHLSKIKATMVSAVGPRRNRDETDFVTLKTERINGMPRARAPPARGWRDGRPPIQVTRGIWHLPSDTYPDLRSKIDSIFSTRRGRAYRVPAPPGVFLPGKL